MKKRIHLGVSVAIAFGLLALPVYAEDDSFDDLDFDDDSFDELDFDDVEFDDESDSAWHDAIAVELSHNIASRKNADWDFTTNATTGVVGWSGSLSPSLFAEFEGQLDWYWADDSRRARSEALEDQYEATINAAFVQSSFADFSVKAGYYTIGWGEVEGSGTLDVINPTADITSGAMDVTGKAQPFVGVDYFAGNLTASAWVNLLADVAEFEGFDEPDSGQEFGAKFTLRMSGSDVSLYGAQLLPNSPVLDLLENEMLVNPYQLVGISANRSFGKTLAKVDVAYKRDLDILTSDEFFVPGNEKINRLDYAAGLEIGFDGGQQLVVSVSNKQILAFDEGFQAIPGFAAKEHTAQGVVTYSDSFLNDDLTLNVGGMGSLDGELALGFATVEYVLNDHWEVSSGVLAAMADEDSAFAAFNEEVQISAGITWQR